MHSCVLWHIIWPPCPVCHTPSPDTPHSQDLLGNANSFKDVYEKWILAGNDRSAMPVRT